MLVCYRCKIELDDKNRNQEHIIHNFLGGKLKSQNLICKDCNEYFGSTIDVALKSQIIIGGFTKLKRDRGVDGKIVSADANGKLYLADPNTRTTVAMPTKPLKLTGVNGEKIIQVEGRDSIKKFISAQSKKHPTLSKDEFNKMFIHFSNSSNITVYPNGHGVHPLVGPDAYRAIVKIAINFYYFKTNDLSYIGTPVGFVKGEHEDGGIYGCYKQTRDELGMGENETSHILYLVGDINNHLLYCYIELFNVYNFVVVLNNTYNGIALQEQYRFDLNNRKVIDSPILINLDSNDIKSWRFNDFNYQGFEDRLRAFNTINKAGFVIEDKN